MNQILQMEIVWVNLKVCSSEYLLLAAIVEAQ